MFEKQKAQNVRCALEMRLGAIEDERLAVLGFLTIKSWNSQRIQLAVLDEARDRYKAELVALSRTYGQELVRQAHQQLDSPYGIDLEPGPQEHTWVSA